MYPWPSTILNLTAMSLAIFQVALVSEDNICLDTNLSIRHNEHLLTTVIVEPILDVRLEMALGCAITGHAVVS